MTQQERLPAEIVSIYARLEQVDSIENEIERTMRRDQLLEELWQAEDEFWGREEETER